MIGAAFERVFALFEAGKGYKRNIDYRYGGNP